MAETKLYAIMDETKELCGKIKDYEGEANQELVINWIYDTLQIVAQMGKLVEEIEDRLDLLEEETEEKKF